jgi:predicted kinase
MKLYTMVGLPASGKSTFANKHKECVIVNTDDIRQEILGDWKNQDNGDLIFKIAYERIGEALNSGHDVIFDATNVQRKYRKKIFQFNAEHVAVYMNVDVEECKRRNALREHRVPDEVIDRMASRLQVPTIDEGFKEIINEGGN